MHKGTWLAACAVVAGICAAGACSSNDSHPPVLGETHEAGSGSSSGVAGSSSGGSSGSSSGAAPACPMDDGGCNTLGLCGAKVNFTEKTGVEPNPAGGTILPGTYMLTEVDVYATGTSWYQETFTLSMLTTDGGAEMDGAVESGAEGGDDGGALEDGGEAGAADATVPDGGADGGASLQVFHWEEVHNGDMATFGSTSGSLRVTGSTTLAIDYTCPSGMNEFPAGYTASAMSMSLFFGAEVFIYQRQ